MGRLVAGVRNLGCLLKATSGHGRFANRGGTEEQSPSCVLQTHPPLPTRRGDGSSLTVLVSFLSGLGGYDMLDLPEGLGRVMNDIYNLLCHLLVV